MDSMSKPVIAINEVASELDSYVIIDVSSGNNAKADYETEHLQGALFVDLGKDLSAAGHSPDDGGRHPLPTLEEFSKLLGKLGIDPRTPVLVYDQQNSANAAARFWWMLTAVGHQFVSVLDGGLQAAKAAGLSMYNGIEQAKPVAAYPAPPEWLLPLASLNEVEYASKTERQTLIDVRSPERFQGLEEPLDTKAGHIPSAINIPFVSNVDADGKFLPIEQLTKKYEHFDADNTIIHCGSGVTACQTLLAMAAAQLPLPKLYIGSWSEWSSRDLPIQTGEN